MKQQTFESSNQDNWNKLKDILGSKSKQNLDQLPQLYRRACHDLSLAKQRRYTPSLIEYLNRLVMSGHHRLYLQGARYRFQWTRFIFFGFPRVLRKNANYVYASLLLFLLPAVVLGVLCYFNSEMIYSTMPSIQVQEMENMYDPAVGKIGRARESDTDVMMFGFYIKNNIGIGFRTFAGGIFFGLGSIFFLFYNGVILGAVSGHLTQLGFTNTFYPFVIGHGAFELTAIVFSGAAGLKLGFSLVSPGHLRRSAALKESAKEAIQIMCGAALMLVIAAFLEAFWSSSTTVPNSIKYWVGAEFWLLVILYCVYSGRNINERFEHGSQ